MNFARLRRRICGLALVLLAMAPASDGAQLIPADRTFGAAWQNSGYPGAIPAPATIVNVRSFGATGDGVTDDRAAVSAAIASLGGAPGVVYFPAGNYRFLSALTVPGGCVLRGERSSNTTLTIEHISDGISITRGQSGVFQPVVSGYAIHSMLIGLRDNLAVRVLFARRIRKLVSEQKAESSAVIRLCHATR